MTAIKWHQVDPSRLSDANFLFLKKIIVEKIVKLYESGTRDIIGVVLYSNSQTDVYKCKFINEPISRFEDFEFELLPIEYIKEEKV